MDRPAATTESAERPKTNQRPIEARDGRGSGFSIEGAARFSGDQSRRSIDDSPAQSHLFEQTAFVNIGKAFSPSTPGSIN
jgi:hypothetical protein